MNIDPNITPRSVLPQVDAFTRIASDRTARLLAAWDPSRGAPVFTVEGTWTTRGWTEWTLGFLYGLPLLVYDLTGDSALLEAGRAGTLAHMPPHLTHTGVHDHGFLAVSTYGTLLRLIAEGRADASDRGVCELALRVSGAVQAARWTALPDGRGFIHSFNGPHSLFIDTMRTLRVLALAHALGQDARGEQDVRTSLLHRLLAHADVTAQYNVYFGTGRDAYNVRGRTAHESIFNTVSGTYRCASSQQGWSPYTTWMRGLAWALLGYAELLPFLASREEKEFPVWMSKTEAIGRFTDAATATADFHIAQTPADGIPYWDAGAPGLARMDDWRARPADPFNAHEPVDSSAAAIAAQGYLRLGLWLQSEPYIAAGLSIARTLFSAPYLNADPSHEGILLHGVYHRPAGWDHIPRGSAIPNGESVLWGDYHAAELALLLRRMAEEAEIPTFYSGVDGGRR